MTTQEKITEHLTSLFRLLSTKYTESVVRTDFTFSKDKPKNIILHIEATLTPEIIEELNK